MCAVKVDKTFSVAVDAPACQNQKAPQNRVDVANALPLLVAGRVDRRSNLPVSGRHTKLRRIDWFRREAGHLDARFHQHALRGISSLT